HRRRVRSAARPDRVQAGGAGGDGRMGRDVERVPRDLGAAGGNGGADLGAGARRRLRLGDRARPMTVTSAVEVVILSETPLRELNQRLHDLDDGRPRRWRVLNPNGAHAVACGVDADVEIEIVGHVGYYCAGMNKHASVRVLGNAGTGVAENMMSGL